MSVRVRLALGSAVIAAIVLFLVAGAAYGLHARSQYDDLDNSLVLTAEHFQEEFGAGLAGDRNDSVSQGPNIQVKLFDRDEEPLGSDAPNVPSTPVLPLQVLAEDDGPPYDAVLRWIPGGGIGGKVGAFATTFDEASGARLRSYVLPVDANSGGGYVLTWASLEQLDCTIPEF